MSNVFLIVDGSSMLSTAYYGTLPVSVKMAKTEEEKQLAYQSLLQTSDGRYTNAMYTMIRSLFKLLDDVKPKYFAVAFDVSRNTFRRTQLGADYYKANRKETASPLKSQFIQMEQFLQDIGVTVLCSPDYEADDYVASVVARTQACNDVDITYILHSKDHDYMQLVSDSVTLYRPMTKSRLDGMLADGVITGNDIFGTNVLKYTPEIVYADCGVRPECVVDLMALTGDVGDGIPGCKGVSSAASLLIDYYKTIDNLYKVIDSCETSSDEKSLLSFWKDTLGVKRSPLKALRMYRDDVVMSCKLAYMCRDIANVSCILSDYQLCLNSNRMVSCLLDYEMKSLIDDCVRIANNN